VRQPPRERGAGRGRGRGPRPRGNAPRPPGDFHAALQPQSGSHDICLFVARRSRSLDPLWVIDQVQPLPR
jgi:hypothetical protein